jgi:hypothetical protein
MPLKIDAVERKFFSVDDDIPHRFRLRQIVINFVSSQMRKDPPLWGRV